MSRPLRVRVFDSFEEENLADLRRRAAMSPDERLRELSVLQRRMWGDSWFTEPMVRTATWEKVDW